MMRKTHDRQSLLKRFVEARKGATAIIFSVMAVPVMALAAGVVDYGTALRVKSELNNTLDAAVLAATQAYALDNSVDTTKIINDFIAKNYTDSGKVLLSSELTVEEPSVNADGELSAQLSVKVPTSFLTLVGFDAFDFSLGSSAMVGGQSVEVALVLDNTGSMSGSKLTALKDSANILIDKLMIDGADNVKVALVPFADYVNIGMANRNEPGLDIPADYTYSWTPSGDHCWNTWPDSTQECTPVKEWTTCYNDGVPYACEKTVSWNCTGDRGDPVRHCEPWTQQSKDYKWFGCMGSRPHDLNVRDEDYATGVPGIMRTWNVCRQIAPVTRLTSDKATITAAIENMNAKRSTYIPAGLAWGWRAISDQAPFADGVPYSDDSVQKVIVLMTDGENTLSVKKWGGSATINHTGDVWGHDADAISNPAKKVEADGYTAELCENIKAKGIVIHTIAFDIPAGSPVEDLMKNCAGNGGQYFDANDAGELADAFKKIALALLNLRLSK